MAKLKRLLAPKFWRVPRKEKKWTVSPRPGPHKKFESLPLQIIVRDILKFAETGKDARTIIKKGEVWVDGKPRKDHAYPVGLFDVVVFPKIKQFYRVVPSYNGLRLIQINEKESNLKICKIVNKTLVKAGKVQLNLNDGKNVLVDDGKYKTGDSVLVELPKLKIVKHLQLEKGKVGIISKGKKSGKGGMIKEIIQGKGKDSTKVVCKFEDKDTEIPKRQFIVVGEDKPLITVGE
jgi:small subunit ribosomal protein S4e